MMCEVRHSEIRSNERKHNNYRCTYIIILYAIRVRKFIFKFLNFKILIHSQCVHLQVFQHVDQTLDHDVLHEVGHLFLELHVVVLFGQMGGANDDVLDGAFVAPAHLLRVRAAAHHMVLEIDLILARVSPFDRELFRVLFQPGLTAHL